MELALEIRDLSFDNQEKLSPEDATIIMNSLVKIGRSNGLEDSDYLPEELRLFLTNAIDPREISEEQKTQEGVFDNLGFAMPDIKL